MKDCKVKVHPTQAESFFDYLEKAGLRLIPGCTYNTDDPYLTYKILNDGVFRIPNRVYDEFDLPTFSDMGFPGFHIAKGAVKAPIIETITETCDNPVRLIVTNCSSSPSGEFTELETELQEEIEQLKAANDFRDNRIRDLLCGIVDERAMNKAHKENHKKFAALIDSKCETLHGQVQTMDDMANEIAALQGALAIVRAENIQYPNLSLITPLPTSNNRKPRFKYLDV